MINLEKMTIKHAHVAMKHGEFSAVDLAKAYLEVIKEKNNDIYAYLEVYDDVVDQAKMADELFKNGSATLLTGIPLAIKDNILIKGRIASGGSKILENYTATYDATVIKKLKEAGAVFLGRTNMDEFAMGSSNEHSAFGVTKNPRDLERVPGGSSGGSAASVAMDGALGALGTDTGGSVRQPASFCGVVGFKPTYGALSRYGMMAMAASLNQIGLVTKTVEDTEILYQAISGHDPLDSMSLPDKTPQADPAKVLGVPKKILDMSGLDVLVRENFIQAIEKLEELGYEIRDIELPNMEAALATYYVIMPAEVSTDMARYDGVRYGLKVTGNDLLDTYKKTRSAGFGPEVRRRIMLGTYVLSAGYYDAYYGKATRVRNYLTQKYKELFKDVDAIVVPTSPTPAFKIGEKSSDPLALYLADIFTVTANLTGMPAISVPSGETGEGLPLGIQFMGPHFSEERLFELGKKFESSSYT